MDPILQVLLSWQFVLFGLAVAAVMYVIRLIVEYIASVLKKDLSTSNLWNNLLLPILPVFFGVAAAIVLKKFPYPGFTPDIHGVVARGDRIIFGLVAGLFSTVMYRVIKSLLYQKLTSAVQNLTPTVVAPGTTTTITTTTGQIPLNQLPPRGQV
jgi:glucan phosphoethanolaminetransferase (alkaline phosphatase superfamily)